MSNSKWGKNVTFTGVNNISPVYPDNRKEILAFRKGLTDGLDDTTITTEAKPSINITKSKKKICLSQHYNRSNIFCMLIE